MYKKEILNEIEKLVEESLDLLLQPKCNKVHVMEKLEKILLLIDQNKDNS